jgi:serine/threonine protein phosphatase PrpC
MDCSSVDVHQNEHPSQRPTNGGSQPYQYLTPPDNVIAASGPFAASTQQLEPLTPQDDPLSMYSFGVAQDPGGRDYQDDRYTCFSVQEGALRLTVAAILDGHHGHAISQLVTESLPHCFVTALARHKNGTNSNSIYIHTILSDTCRELEDLTYAAHMSNMNISTGGTTLLLLVLSPDQLWTASIGDCKGVVSSRGTPEVLNICHNPPVLSEQARFEAAGLRIYGDHVAGSDINVCRTLGDYDLGFPLKWRDAIEADPEGPLSSLPDISLRNIDPLDEFIIAATDGLWDYYGLDSTVVTEARKDLRRNRNDPQACAEFLIQQSLVKQRELLHEGTPGDNVTVMVVSLKKVPEIPKSSGSRLNLRGAGSGPLSGGFDNGGGSSGSGRYTVAGNGSGSHGGGGGVGGRLAPVMSSGESGESQLSFIEQEQQAV